MQINAISLSNLSYNNFGKAKKVNNYDGLYDNFKVSSEQYIPGNTIVENLGPVYGFPIKKRNRPNLFTHLFFKIWFLNNNNWQYERNKAKQLDAIEDMINSAKEIGANGIINFEKTNGLITRVKGTAVKIKKIDNTDPAVKN